MQKRLTSRNVEELYKRTCLFIHLKLLILRRRKLRRVGYTIEKRLEIELHNRKNFFMCLAYDTIERRASYVVFRFLLAEFTKYVFAEKLAAFNGCVTMIQQKRAYQSMCRIHKQNYIKTYIHKERNFIANFYKAKNNKSGKQIFHKIMGIEDKLIQQMIFLYMMLKQKQQMIDFYNEQVEIIEQRHKVYTNLIKKIKECTTSTVEPLLLEGMDMLNEYNPHMIYLEVPQMPDTKGKTRFQMRKAKEELKYDVVKRLNNKLESDEATKQLFYTKMKSTKTQILYLEQYLYQGTDNLVKTDQSVKASLKQQHEQFEKKY